jgi:ribose transport system substrate-binding protein
MKRSLFIVILLILAFTTAAAQDDTIKIGALVKNTSNPFFVRMAEGYEFAGKRYNIEVVVGSTPEEEMEAEQLEILEGWLEEGDFDGFIVTPFRATSLNPALAVAAEQGIPVINIDELIPAEDVENDGLNIATKIASNNVRAGSTAAEYLINLLPLGSDVAVIEGAVGTQSSIDRVEGFIDTAEANGLRVIASQPADWDTAKAYEVAKTILETQQGVRAIFAANDGMGLGAVQAVEELNMAGDVLVVSVDAIPEALQAVEEGRLAGTVAQFPEEMAVLAVEAMRKVIQGRPVAPEIESPVVLISQENLEAAQSQLGDPELTDIRIGALTKNLSNSFFVDMVEGYEMAAEDFGVEVVTGSTPDEEMEEEQLEILELWVNEDDFDAFIVTPFRATSLNPVLSTLADTPVVNIDELIPAEAIDTDGLSISTQIASNNVRAGSLAADYLIDTLEAGSDVAVIEGAVGTQSSIDRVQGFIDTAESGGLRVVASQPADWDTARAVEVTKTILEAQPDVKAIFAANDGMGLGVIQALEELGLEGEVLVVSVDAIPEALEAVEAGRLAGTVKQFPDEMAYLAVENAIKVIEGRPIPPFVESPVALITREE